MTRTDLASEVGTGNDARPADEGSTSRDSATWTIGQIAEEFAITHRTVRHYEELNLISPERRGTARIYHRRERTRQSDSARQTPRFPSRGDPHDHRPVRRADGPGEPASLCVEPDTRPARAPGATPP